MKNNGVQKTGTIGITRDVVQTSLRGDTGATGPWHLVVPCALVLSIVGIVGDLVESLLKRDAEVKDTGRLLPGMGGILDRIDAPLLALPVMYYMLLAYFYFTVR